MMESSEFKEETERHDMELAESNWPTTTTTTTTEEGHQVPIMSVRLDVRDVNYYVGTKDRQILHHVTTTFSPGSLTALMGPSGAGKTTLLTLLMNNTSGRTEGEVLVNGRSLKQVASKFKRLYTLIPQDDTLLPSLTPRETLRFVAGLRLPQTWSREKKYSQVEKVLSHLSLFSCGGTRIGDVDKRGISGGERKRVSIGCELLVNPSVLFVDEPTSGLDSKTARDVVNTLSSLSKEGRTLICTIHQPSYKLLQMFDGVVLLSCGRIVYSGAVDGLEKHFALLGFTTPPGENPADSIMEVLQSDDVTTRDKVMTGWPTRPQQVVVVTKGPDLSKLHHPPPVSWWHQTWVLLHRCLVDTLKDKDKFLGGVLLKLAVGLLVGLVWLNQSRHFTQSSIYPTTAALFIGMVSSIIDTFFVTIMTLPNAKALLLREYRNNYYPVLPYYTALLTTTIICNVFYSTFLSTPIIFLLGLRPSCSQYFLLWAIYALLAVCGATLGLLVGATVKDAQMAQQVMMPSVIPFLLFSGFLLPYENIPSYFRWLYHLSPFTHALNALRTVIYRDVTFPDCPPHAPCGCYPTGQAFLTLTHATPDRLTRSIIIIPAISVVIAVLGVISMKRLVTKKI